MGPFEKCPVCDGEVETKEVEKLLKGGTKLAVTHVEADVCLQCGEKLYHADDVRRFEEIRQKLAAHDVEGFQLPGQSYQVA